MKLEGAEQPGNLKEDFLKQLNTQLQNVIYVIHLFKYQRSVCHGNLTLDQQTI